jgi:hypothetical protein
MPGLPTSPLARAKALAADLLAANGLVGWEFGFAPGKRVGGYVRPLAGRPGRIELSRAFALRATEAEVREVLADLVARALSPPGRGRGDEPGGSGEPVSG